MFMFREDLQKHLLLHDTSEYRCSHCGRKRKNADLLRTHVQSHFLNEKYGCNVCDKRFKKKKNLEKHLVCVHFICQYCGHTSESKKEYSIHIQIHDDLTCLLCKKVFSSITRLKYHYQLLHGHQDFYSCAMCFQRFAKRSALHDHMQLRHRGQSKFSCDICSTPFLYWQEYQNHFARTHLKKFDNKFDCSFCDFTTNLNSKLKFHIEKSSGLGFFCKKCQIRLECKGQFDKHMKKHVGENIWTCDYCPRIYKTDGRLRLHVVAVHPEEALAENPKVHHCLLEGCDSFYTTKSSLARHLRKKHSSLSKSQILISDDDSISDSVEYTICKKLDNANKTISNQYQKSNSGLSKEEKTSKRQTFANNFRDIIPEANSNEPMKKKSRLDNGSKQSHLSHEEVSNQNNETGDMNEKQKMHITNELEKSNSCQPSQEEILKQSNRIMNLNKKHEMCIVNEDEDSNQSQSSFSCSEKSISPRKIDQKQKIGQQSNHCQPSQDDETSKHSNRITDLNKTQEMRIVNKGEVSNESQSSSEKSNRKREIDKEQKENRNKKQQNNINCLMKKPFEVSWRKECTPKKGYSHMTQPLSSDIEVNVFHCLACKKVWFDGEAQFKRHLRTHSKLEWDDVCNDCDIELGTLEDAVKHLALKHLKVDFVT